MFGHRFRPALTLGASMLAIVLSAQPAGALTPVSFDGPYGMFALPDTQLGQRGANCDYKAHKSNGTHPLKDVSVRGPSMFAKDTGSGTPHQWVGWRYKIQRDTNFDDSFGTYFTSPVVKAKATDTAAASFSRRTWTAPSNLKRGNYRVQVTLLWYQPGSSTTIQGKLVALIDWYHVKGGGADTVRVNDCYTTNSDNSP